MEVYIGILEILLVVMVLFLIYISKKVKPSQMKDIFIIDLLIMFYICIFLII